MNSYMRQSISFSVVLLLLGFCNVQGQTWSDRGLEYSSDKLQLIVESLGEDAASIGLTKSRLQTKCELRLRQAGFTVMDSSLIPYLYVNINIHNNSFACDVSFRRVATFLDSGNMYATRVSTWSVGSLGAHGGSASYIVESLDDKLDIFLNEFLKANPHFGGRK